MPCFLNVAIFYRLGNTFAELANVYYRDEGRRVKARIEKKSFGSIELHIRYCFKVSYIFCRFLLVIFAVWLLCFK